MLLVKCSSTRHGSLCLDLLYALGVIPWIFTVLDQISKVYKETKGGPRLHSGIGKTLMDTYIIVGYNNKTSKIKTKGFITEI